MKSFPSDALIRLSPYPRDNRVFCPKGSSLKSPRKSGGKLNNFFLSFLSFFGPRNIASFFLRSARIIPALILAAFILTVLSLSFFSSPSLAQLYDESIGEEGVGEASPRVKVTLGDLVPPVTVEADRVSYMTDPEKALFSGSVTITRGAEVMTGDYAVFHEPSMTAEISGKVRIITADFTATAERAAVNMDLLLAKIYGGRAFFPERHYYVGGQVLERQGPDTLYVKNATFTTCDGPAPSWSLGAEEITVNKGGLAESSGTVFRNPYFPMLYLPYMLVPVKNERQTGFLLPQAASSTRDGFMVALPFFWAIREDYDLTLLPIYRTDRGAAWTLEGRYNLSFGQGIWLATYLSDKKDNFYTNRSSDQERVNNRHLSWIRAQNNWKANDFDLNLDLDLVSDPTFLYAFRNDPDGFFYSRNLLAEYFGRTISEELNPLRTSTFFAQKSGPFSYFRGTVSYVENLYRKNNVDTLQNYPSLFFSLVSKPITALEGFFGGTPRFGIDIQYDYYTRRTDAYTEIDETGHRLLFSPSFFWFHNMSDKVSLKTGGSLSFSAYKPYGKRPGAKGLDDHDSFEAGFSGDFTAELSTTLSRVYHSGRDDSATLHQFTPVVSFEIARTPDQDRFPYFDRLDRRLNQRTIRYGFWNTLIQRSPEPMGEDGAQSFGYRELFKLGIFHSYEFAGNLKWAEQSYGRYYTTGYFDKGVGPLDVELEIDLTPNFKARLLSSLDGRTGDFVSHDISLNISDDRGDSASIIYDFESNRMEYGGPSEFNNVNQIRGDLTIELGGGFSTTYSARYDFDLNRALETYVSLNYRGQCYGLGIIWEDTNDQSRIAFMVNLLGLGSFGSGGNPLTSAPGETYY
jgi:LPS-assembly protein